MTEIIKLLMQKKDLDKGQAEYAVGVLLSGGYSPVKAAAFLTALQLKGATATELAGGIKAMRSKAVAVDTVAAADIISIGGNTPFDFFDLTVACSAVAAACGVNIAKYGFEPTAQTLSQLGYDVDMPLDKAVIKGGKIGWTFLSGNACHPSLKAVQSIRQEMGTDTVFDIMAPLCHPAAIGSLLVGVPSVELLRPVAGALKECGVGSAVVVCGNDGFAGVSLSARTQVAELFLDGNIVSYSVTAEDFGLATAQDINTAAAHTAQQNADITTDILSGKKSHARDIVIINTAMLLKTQFKKPLKECALVAASALDSSAALDKLKMIVTA